MEPDMLHKPDRRVTDIPLVDMPRDAETDPDSLREICVLLEQGNRIVCLCDRTGGGDFSILTQLRDSLHGFVALLDHRELLDLPASLARRLSLGTDQTDENILHSRWIAFTEVTQRCNLPITLIVPHADTLPQSRFTRIIEFLEPINGRLILAGSGEVSGWFTAPAVAPDAIPSDKGVPPPPDRGRLPEPTQVHRVTMPITDISDLYESSALTDDAPRPAPATAAGPESVPPPAPTPRERIQKEAHQSRVSRRSGRKPKTIGWLYAGLGFCAVLGFMVVTLPTPYRPAGIDRWFEGIAGSLLENLPQLVQRHESAPAREVEETGVIAHRDMRQQKDEDAMGRPSAEIEEMTEAQPAGQPMSPENRATAESPAAPVAAEPVTQFSALEQSPATAGDPGTEVEPGAAPAAIDAGAGAQPEAPPAAEAESLQAPEPEATPDPEENARIAIVYLQRAEREFEAGNLQQSLLEVARGLDADPDNQRLLELRREVLAAMDAFLR